MYFNILIPQTAMDKTKLFMDESHFLMYSCYTGKPRINWISFRIFIGFLSFPWDIPSANTETVENYAEYKNPQQPQRLLGILFAVQESVRGKPGIMGEARALRCLHSLPLLCTPAQAAIDGIGHQCQHG